MTDTVVDVRGLHVDLDDRQILHGIDVAVRPGEVVAVIGPNASGKSTLVRAMVGLIPATAGEIQLFGTPLPDFTDWQRIGYVPQRTTASGGVPATVREMVSSGRLARRRLFRPAGAADRSAVDRAIELVGLTQRAHDSVDTLSGGQQQRVLIARAAAGEPDLLVLDEPNAGVDRRSQEAFARALRTFVATGRTVVVVLHELGPIEPLIDRCVILDAGRVSYDGPRPAPGAATGHADEHHHQRDETGLFG